MTKLRTWLDEIPQVVPKLALGKAMYYLEHQWSRLVGYLDHRHYPIDNHLLENAIGRKNWLFSRSVPGVKARANRYSLIATAKANGLESYAYLKQVFTDRPNVVTYDGVDRLLPNNVNDADA